MKKSSNEDWLEEHMEPEYGEYLGAKSILKIVLLAIGVTLLVLFIAFGVIVFQLNSGEGYISRRYDSIALMKAALLNGKTNIALDGEGYYLFDGEFEDIQGICYVEGRKTGYRKYKIAGYSVTYDSETGGGTLQICFGGSSSELHCFVGIEFEEKQVEGIACRLYNEEKEDRFGNVFVKYSLQFTLDAKYYLIEVSNTAEQSQEKLTEEEALEAITALMQNRYLAFN